MRWMMVLSGDWWQDETMLLASKEVEQVEVLMEVEKGW